MPEHRWRSTDLPNMAGRTVIVTGASSGIGLQSSRALAGVGTHVVMAVRDPGKAAPLAQQIDGDTEIRRLDVADLSSVRAFADAWDGPIDVLINNAGIMEGPERRSPDGFELQMATNHLGPFLLTNLLLPLITGRVVTVSSQLHHRAKHDLDDLNWTKHAYNTQLAYANSKLANLLFTFELQRRLETAHSNVLSVAAHPGIAKTNLASEAGGIAALVNSVAGRLFNDAVRGALPIEYAATQDVLGASCVGPRGLGHLRGYPGVHAPSAQARDARLARQLWELSDQLTAGPGEASQLMP